MIDVIAGLFLAAHGLVHLLYVTPAPADDPNYPFVPESRWIVRTLRLKPASAKAFAGSLAVLVAIVFVAAGVALLADASVWERAAVIASAISLVLMVVFFHPWLSIGIAIDVAIIASLMWLHVPASLFEG